ncbi:MAG: hypothetical protein ACFFBE_01120 [Promethearchaeota archaeon]
MVYDKFWEVIEKFNIFMKSAIEGPDCLIVCNGDCCSIKIDVPKILANEYIVRGYANKSDFIRSDVFSFKLRFDEKKRKCFLYDKEINGCSVHASGIKPPQCWIYPTNFSNPEKKDLSCKNANGWKIIDFDKAKEAERLLQYYIFLCQLEAKTELRNIRKRVIRTLTNGNLRSLLKNTRPSHISGFKDDWDCFTILPAEGISLQLKKFCEKYNETCDFILNNDFIECMSICDEVIQSLINFLQQKIFNYVKKRGADTAGEYLFNDLQLE